MQASTAARVDAQSERDGWPRWALALFVAITFALGNSIGSCATGGVAKIEDRMRSVEVWEARLEGRIIDIDRRLDRIERYLERATAQ